ncbi:MAG: F-type H+-transporting ATPase subunit delta [Verrucomicrobiales bacterium]|jgi:F-type H+-transporting ATPase subunit delta
MKSSKDAIRTARQLLKLTMVDGKLDGAKVRAVIKKISESKPRGFLGVLNAYGSAVRIELAKRHAVIESAVKLEKATQESVTSDLKSKYGNDLTFEFAINEELIGGMRVKVGSDVWDGSVKARLARLAEAFS